MRRNINRPFLLLAIVLLGCFNLFLNNWYVSLWDQDEAAYAGFAHQMRETGNWLVPEFTWSEPHRKTPFHFWAIAAAYSVFGENEFAVRFPSALAVLGTCLILFVMGRRLFGADVALTAALILLCSFFVPNLGKVSVTDALLMFFETLAALSLLNYLHQPHWKWNVWLWLAVSMGLLVKGPPILILVGGMWFFLLLFYPKRKLLIGTHPWFFLPLAAVPLLLWGRLAWLQDGGTYIRWMVDWYILRRATGHVFGQTGPPGYYLLTFLLAFLPWLAFLPSALADVLNFRRNRHDAFYPFIVSWLLAGWILYELLPSKLPAYAIGAYPAIALAIARQTLTIQPENIRRSRWISFGNYAFLVISLLLSLGLIGAGIYLLDRPGIIAACLLGVFWGGVSIFIFSKLIRNEYNAAFPAIMLGAQGFLLIAWLLVVPSFEEPRSATKRVASFIDENLKPATIVVFAKNFNLPSLPYYVIRAGNTYTQQEDYTALQSQYFSSTPTAIVMDEERYQAFAAHLQGQQLQPGNVKIINGWVTDRGKQIKYVVLANQAAQTGKQD